MSLLDQLYPGIGGTEKVASEDGFDLTQISAADLLEALAEDDEHVVPAEKVAAEDVDFESMSNGEIAEYFAALDEQEKVASEDALIEKMAADGSLDAADLSGRVMARAFLEEINGSSEDVENISVDTAELDKEASAEFATAISEMTAEDLIELVEAGEVDIEKVAGAWSAVKGMFGKAKAPSARERMLAALKGAKAKAKAGGKRYADLATAKGPRGSGSKKEQAKAYAAALRARDPEALKALGTQAGTGAVVGSAGYAASR